MPTSFGSCYVLVIFQCLRALNFLPAEYGLTFTAVGCLLQDREAFAAAHADDPSADSEHRRPYTGWVKGVTLRHGCAGTAWNEDVWQRAKQLLPLLDTSASYVPPSGDSILPKVVVQALDKVKDYEDRVGARIYASVKDVPLHLCAEGDKPPSKSVFNPHKDVCRGQLVILDMSRASDRSGEPNRGVDIARVDKVDTHPLHRDKAILTVTYLVPHGLEKGDSGHSVDTPWPADWFTAKLVPWQIPTQPSGRRKRRNDAARFGDWVEAGINADVVLWSCNITKKSVIYSRSQSIVAVQWRRLIDSITSGTPVPPVEAGEDTRDESSDDEMPLAMAAALRQRRRGAY